MNNELIERIDKEIQNLMGQRDVIERLLPNNTAVRELTQIIKVLMDCKAALSQAEPVASSQDVDEFIESSERQMKEVDGFVIDAVYTDDLREWMAGHARVPVDEFEGVLWLAENPARARDSNSKARRSIIKCRNAMLTASKESVKLLHELNDSIYTHYKIRKQVRDIIDNKEWHNE
jgi:hypothetical protein